jgi:hypothetical protein
MDICARQVVADLSLDIERAGVGFKRMWREPPFEPFGIFFIGNAEGRWRRTGNAESTAGFLSGLAARGDDIRRQAVGVKAQQGWCWAEIATGHHAMVTAPDELTRMLIGVSS